MFQIVVDGNGPGHHHKAVKRAFAHVVRELRKIDPDLQARFISQDGTEPDHVDHPSGKGYTGENPQLISGNETSVV